MKKNRVIINVYGGIVQSILADDPEALEVIVRDADIDGCDDSLYENENKTETYREFEFNVDDMSHNDTEPFAHPLYCKRCDHLLDDNGLCQDETCPYSDRQQNEEFTEE